MMWKCKLLTIWFTVRYGWAEILQGVVITGHDLAYTGEIHNHEGIGSHWEMKCRRCGIFAGTDVAPDR